MFTSLTLVIPLFVSWFWVQYSDIVKKQNINGQSLTSNALSSWNFGSYSQRFSSEFWFDLVFQRSVLGNLGAGLGLLIICRFFFLFHARKKEVQFWVLITSIFLFIFPLLVFSNLHIVHWYYQVSAQFYLFFALGIALSYDLRLFKVNFLKLHAVFIVLIVAVNLSVFHSKFQDAAYEEFTPNNSLILKVSNFLKKNTLPDDPILVYGMDWSSELAFVSERKAATLAPWMKGYGQGFVNPAILFEGANPGAIIDCIWRDGLASIHPTRKELDEIALKVGLVNYTSIDGVCNIWSRARFN